MKNAKRIIIIGCPGGGKSRLAKILANKLNLPLVHLDQLFWKPNWTETPRDEFDRLLLEELKKDKWILDGNFARTLPLRLEYCDHVILLNYPTLTCIFRVIKRVITNYGKTRPDMTEGCEERFDLSFLKFIKKFKKIRLKKMREQIATSKKPLIEITNDRQLKALLKRL